MQILGLGLSFCEDTSGDSPIIGISSGFVTSLLICSLQVGSDSFVVDVPPDEADFTGDEITDCEQPRTQPTSGSAA